MDLTEMKLTRSSQEDSDTFDRNEYTFDEEELVELALLRDEETDALVDAGFISKQDQWNDEHRDGFTFDYPEMTLRIFTGDGYPVKPLTQYIANISLPRLIVDRLRVKLRGMNEADRRSNSICRWRRREFNYFDFEMAALHVVAETAAYLKDYRSDPSHGKHQTPLRKTDYELSQKRREILAFDYGFYDLLADLNERVDPFNPDWSRRETDMTNERRLALSEVGQKSEIEESMFGIDPSSVQGHDLINSILGRTPEKISTHIPDTFRILHIESVIRRDLATRFLRRQAAVREELEELPLNILKGSMKRETRLELGKRANEIQTLIDHLVTPELTFHCTREDLVPSIVRQGFLKPARESDIRCGATYGQLSPILMLKQAKVSIARQTQHSRLCIRISARPQPRLPNSPLLN